MHAGVEPYIPWEATLGKTILVPTMYLFWAKSLDNLHFFRPIFTNYIHALFGLPLPLGGPFTCITRLFLISDIAGLRWTCPNNLKQVYSNFIPYWWYPQVLSKAIISNFVLLSFYHASTSTFSSLLHPFLHMLLLDLPKSCPIGHYWSNHYRVKISLQSYWRSSVTGTPEASLHFNLPAFILCSTSSWISPSLLIIEPR